MRRWEKIVDRALAQFCAVRRPVFATGAARRLDQPAGFELGRAITRAERGGAASLSGQCVASHPGSRGLRALPADASREKPMQKADTLESDIHKSEIQHLDAVLHFTHVSEDSTKLTKAETSSESTPSAFLK
jgi:hypothetical protein